MRIQNRFLWVNELPAGFEMSLITLAVDKILLFLDEAIMDFKRNLEDYMKIVRKSFYRWMTKT